MGDGAAVPPGLWERIRQIVADELGKLLRSGALRNASISGGGLTIKGGFLRLLAKSGLTSLFYVGPVSPSLPDGSDQPGWIVRREDGTVAVALYDPAPSPDFKQFLSIWDRTGHIVMSDDTDSGVGLARPYLDGAFQLARVQDFPKTTNGSFETIFRARMQKQHPRLYVEAWGATDTAGTTGEVQIMVNGTQLGATQTASFGLVSGYAIGPVAIGGNFGDILSVEIQARRTAGTGNVQVGAAWVEGRQS